MEDYQHEYNEINKNILDRLPDILNALNSSTANKRRKGTKLLFFSFKANQGQPISI